MTDYCCIQEKKYFAPNKHILVSLAEQATKAFSMLAEEQRADLSNKNHPFSYLTFRQLTVQNLNCAIIF